MIMIMTFTLRLDSFNKTKEGKNEAWLNRVILINADDLFIFLLNIERGDMSFSVIIFLMNK